MVWIQVLVCTIRELELVNFVNPPIDTLNQRKSPPERKMTRGALYLLRITFLAGDEGTDRLLEIRLLRLFSFSGAHHVFLYFLWKKLGCGSVTLWTWAFCGGKVFKWRIIWNSTFLRSEQITELESSERCLTRSWGAQLFNAWTKMMLNFDVQALVANLGSLGVE